MLLYYTCYILRFNYLLSDYGVQLNEARVFINCINKESFAVLNNVVNDVYCEKRNWHIRKFQPIKLRIFSSIIKVTGSWLGTTTIPSCEIAKDSNSLFPPRESNLSVGSTAKPEPYISVSVKPVFQNCYLNFVYHACFAQAPCWFTNSLLLSKGRFV